MERATEAKCTVEDAQRELRRRREESGESFIPRYFERRDGRWEPKLKCVALRHPGTCIDTSHSIPRDDSSAAIDAVQTWIWPPTAE